MALKTFNQAVSVAFALPDTTTKLIKTSLIGLCSDVDRYFRVNFGVDMYEEVNEKDFYKIKGVFPNFRSLNLEQFNRLLFTFISIRDLSAHLFLNKPIYLDDDLKEYIKGLVDSPYSLTNGKEATLFGIICVVLLFSQNHQLWYLNTGIMRHTIFSEVQKSSIAQFQQDFQKKYSVLVGIGKPCRPEEYLFITKTDITFFIEEVKKTLTRLIFDFEGFSGKKQKMSSRVSNIKIMLNKYDCLKDKQDLIERICILRNCWLHGYRLFDHIKVGDKDFDFDFDYLFEILIDIKNAFAGTPRSYEILNDISRCGSSMIDFYTLRNIEISYKILDSKLFEQEKISERITKSVTAYQRAMSAEVWFYNGAKSLMHGNSKTWYLAANKFKDKKERMLKGDRIEVYEFTSDNGFDIGSIHIDNNEMVLTNIDCPIEDQLTINGKRLEDYKEKVADTYGIFDIYLINF